MIVTVGRGRRAGAVLIVAALVAVACDRVPWARQPAPPPPPAAAPMAAAPPEAAAKAWFTPSPQQQPGMHLAYTHAVELQVGGGALRAHFTAARDRCLNSPALHCLMLHASIARPQTYDGRPATEAASLQVRLPHDQVTPFASALTDALPGEKAGLVRVLSQSTDAEDLSRPVADVAQRTTQLSDYLASLKALGGRLTISVSDLVKIAGETAQAQSQIEAAQAEQRDLSLRVDTESLNVSFAEPAPPVVVQDPIDQTWSQATDILRTNAAAVLQVSIAVLPWLPLALLGLLLLPLLRRLIFGRRPRAAPEVRVVS